MVFSSPLFLFIYLPFVLVIYFLIKQPLRNLFLFAISVLFYIWGENYYILVMLTSILISYIGGIAIECSHKKFSIRITTIVLLSFISINILALVYFKYFNFLLSFFSNSYKFDNAQSIHLPIGISFFTFQAISYLIDIYRREVVAEPSFINLGMYKSFFPQLIAGPIVRYHDISDQVTNRKITIKKFNKGMIRFIWGLGKKVIIANPLAAIADSIFNTPIGELSTVAAWLGIVCYSLQIYYDFSGYSDMAIGLGRMFGFKFLENFNYPYIAKSVQEFWRRWHISLSSWFRDYVYIPLGGSKSGKIKTYRNLIIVFFLTGLWHGANLTFIAWGMFHGLFIILERVFLKDTVFNRVPKFILHIYTIFVVLIGWIFFRADTIEQAVKYIIRLFSSNVGYTNNNVFLFFNNYNILIVFLALVFIMPVSKLISQQSAFIFKRKLKGFYPMEIIRINSFILSVVLFIWSCMELAANSYNPFIYFRF